jgi:hypothetical protein
MANIGDPAVALVVDGRLIRAAPLQVIAADEAHVVGFRRSANLLRNLRTHRGSGHRN